MSNNKQKATCRIIDYVEMANPDLHRVIKSVCADGSLSNLKGKAGVTFLMPDKAFTKTVADYAESADPEKHDMANDMINALIIRDNLKKPSDWMAHKDDIPNSIFPKSQHVEIDSATADTVIFKSGAKAVIDPNFIDSSRKRNLSVWKLTGSIPVTTDKPATGKYSRMQPKKGGYAVSDLNSQAERFKIALAVENEYALACIGGKCGRDVYTKCALGLVNYLLNVVHDESTVIEKVLPLISLDCIDFYLLVEPHRVTGTPLLDDNVIAGWWKWRSQNPPCDCQAMVRCIQDLLDSQKSHAMIYSADGRGKIEAAKADAMNSICNVLKSKPRTAPGEIRKDYEILEQRNMIGSVGPVFPDQLAQFYAHELGLKEIQDELRYTTFGWFKDLESTRPFDHGKLHEITNFIGECLRAGTQEERAKSLKLLNEKTLKFQIEPQAKITEIGRFVCSTMFLYTPMTKAEVQDSKLKRPALADVPKMNQQEWLYNRHARVLGNNANDNTRIIVALRSLDVNSLPEELRSELKNKFGAM